MHILIVRQILFDPARLTDMTQQQVCPESLYFIINVTLNDLIFEQEKPEYGANSVESPGRTRLNSCSKCDFFSTDVMVFACIAVAEAKFAIISDQTNILINFL